MKCPNCGSERVKKAGKIRNKLTVKQGYRCKECNRYFVERDGFQHKHYPKHIICAALHLYAEGLSLAKVRDFLWQHFGFKPADSTILDWVKCYSKMLSKFERKLEPEVKGRIHVDELVVKVGGKRCYVLHAVDSKTKYCFEGTLDRHRNTKAYEGFFKRLKRRMGRQIRALFEREGHKPPKQRGLVIFVSDKLGAIKRAFNRHLYRIARLVHGVPIACKRFGLRFNNNPVERRNQDVKQRYKVMRGFKSFQSARAFLRLCTVVYNFVRHGTKETPAHRARVWPGLGRNRLADLIALSAR
ncbi:MAG: DDE-type integrase/transposase/recombinase [Methanobacteriota archaeon]